MSEKLSLSEQLQTTYACNIQKLWEMPPIDIRPFLEIVAEQEALLLVTIGLNLNLFTRLRKSCDINELAEQLDTVPEYTMKFCDALVALGLINKEESLYVNNQISQTFLNQKSPFYQGHLLQLKKRQIPQENDIYEALKGKYQRKKNSGNYPFNREFILAMAEGTVRGGLQRTLKEVSALAHFQECESLLDLGGGHGLYALSFAEINPKITACVFDLPEVIENTTCGFIEHFKAKDRVHPIPGDYTKDALGTEYDIVFASHVFYGSDEKVKKILRQIYSALNPGGILLSKHYCLDADGTAPKMAVLFNLTHSMEKEDYTSRVRTVERWGELFRDNGLVAKKTIDISTDWDPSRLIVAKKID